MLRRIQLAGVFAATVMIGGAAIALPTAAVGSANKGKPPTKRQILAKPDLALLPEAR